MLLRRVIEHVKSQNWTAIFLDFVIVVSGVFIGIQVANYNTTQGERREYEMALERFRQESSTNLVNLKEIETDSVDRIGVVTSGYDALLSCTETPKNRADVEKGLDEMTGTMGIDLITSALEELTENQTLLKYQPEETRQSLKDSRKAIERLMMEAKIVESVPFLEKFYENPIIAIGARNEIKVTIADSEHSYPNRSITLAAPLNIACEDNRLLKSFYTWEMAQSNVPIFSALLREIIETDLELID